MLPIRFLRERPFAKYVAALVGLVVLGLAVSGAVWISHRAARGVLTDAMGAKAEATAKRVEQSISELERQISWVTRASVVTLEQHRNDYAKLLSHVAPISQLSLLNGQGREQLRLSRTAISESSGADYSSDPRFTAAIARGVSFSPAYFAGSRPFMSIAVAHAGFNAGVTVAEIDLGFLSEFLGEHQVGKAGFAYVVDPRGKVLARSAKGPGLARDLSALPQVAALIAAAGKPLAFGTDSAGRSVLTASSTVQRLGWIVFFEQPAAQAFLLGEEIND